MPRWSHTSDLHTHRHRMFAPVSCDEKGPCMEGDQLHQGGAREAAKLDPAFSRSFELSPSGKAPTSRDGGEKVEPRSLVKASGPSA